MDNTFFKRSNRKDRRTDRQCERATRCRDRRKNLLR